MTYVKAQALGLCAGFMRFLCLKVKLKRVCNLYKMVSNASETEFMAGIIKNRNL